jgi:hypothetical protein
VVRFNRALTGAVEEVGFSRPRVLYIGGQMKTRVYVRQQVPDDLLGVYGEENVRDMLREFKVVVLHEV